MMGKYLSCLDDGSEPDGALLKNAIAEIRNSHPYFSTIPSNAAWLLNRIIAGCILQRKDKSVSEMKKMFDRVCVTDYEPYTEAGKMFDEHVYPEDGYILGCVMSLQKRIKRWLFMVVDDTNPELARSAVISGVRDMADGVGVADAAAEYPDTCVFEVRSAYDKPLNKDAYVRAPYEKSIQVGTDLTDVRLESCEYRDNEGDNISDTNRQLCEITALYWMWKHSSYGIVGLVHYRRHFLLPDRWTNRMTANDVDIIVPLPLYIEPSVEENYRFRHVSSDWDHMLDFMRENHADQMDAVEKCFSDTYYHPCNMFVMKREVFDEYCEWLFPILFYVMDKVGSREDVYQNRYPAFIAERLLTLFCYINRDRYKIVFADKNFLQ